MKAALLVLSLILAPIGVSTASEPEMFRPGPGGDSCMDWVVLWADYPDFAAGVASSEAIAGYDLVSEIANDLIIERTATVRKVSWWGVYWNGFEGSPNVSGFHLRFYLDASGIPETAPFAEYPLPEDVCGERLADGGDMYSQYVWEHCVVLLLEPGHYWFSVQAADHEFPPQWGRLGGEMTQVHSSCIRSEYFGHAEWVPIIDVVGAAFDASQRFEDECILWPTKVTGWGAIKGLYR